MTTDLRFGFGENWARFLRHLTPSRIATAEASLRDMLGVRDLVGKTFLDVGCGSGLFSLAARRLGAKVHSFDYDAHSVGCAEQLRARYFPGDAAWTIERGSALDAEYLRSLGVFDVVYAWGVLHHTGEMWRALDLVSERVAADGRLFIAIYNDQGTKSAFWRRVKQVYNRLPSVVHAPFVAGLMAPFELRVLAKSVLSGHGERYVRSWTHYESARGMSRWHDMVDWVGGYPFEVATVARLSEFHEQRGFRVDRVVPTGSLGCNELVMTRVGARQPS